MIGSIIGDILGHPYESWLLRAENKNVNLFLPMCKFTDDTVLTIAVADSILKNITYHESLKYWALKYPERGFGSSFYEWFNSKDLYTNNSYSNGCAMRISPMGYAFESIEKIKEEVRKSIEYTHNCEESFDGAFSVALSIFLARKGNDKEEIKKLLKENIPNNSVYHNLDYSIEDIKKWDKRNIRCNITVPQSLICFFQSTDYEDCIRNAIYSEGDCDTIAAISGGISESYYKKIPQNILKFCSYRIPNEFQEVLFKFKEKYQVFY